MASKLEEQIISQALRPILADLAVGAEIPDSEQFRRDVLGGLSWWIPGIIGEIHPEFSGMGLDGIDHVIARKTGEREAEIYGECIFIEDQTQTPLYVNLQLAEYEDEVSWALFKLGEALKGRPGERGKYGMKRYLRVDRAFSRIHKLSGNADKIDWVYKVTFGQKRPAHVEFSR